LSNSPLGTDVGLLPSRAAEDLDCAALRAVCIRDGEGPYPASVLELYGPDGEPPMFLVRSISALDDGGRWTFELAGVQQTFERPDLYTRRRTAERFPPEVLLDYLRSLSVPVGDEPEWREAILVESTR
jgi:hypothetical protein